MQSKLLIAIALISLTACATTAPDPVINTVIQQTDIPVPVYCKAAIPVAPVFSFPKLQLSDNIYDKSKVLLADKKLHEGYEIELLAALNSCIK